MSNTSKNWNVEIHSGPDELDRYTFTVSWDEYDPAGCSTCGGAVREGRCVGYASGSTPERRQGCGATIPMKKGQVFHAKLPAWYGSVKGS